MEILSMGLVQKKHDQYFTYKDYLSWPEGERWELINGEAFNMSPAPSRFHQNVVLELATIIKNWLKGKPCQIYIAPFDVRLADPDDPDELIDNVVQPDIVVICNPKILDEKGAKGSPDWIIEILSPHTSKKDWNEKFNLYEKHGVREYWIIDPIGKIIYIYQRNEKGVYDEIAILEKKGIAESIVLKGLQINVEDVFNS